MVVRTGDGARQPDPHPRPRAERADHGSGRRGPTHRPSRPGGGPQAVRPAVRPAGRRPTPAGEGRDVAPVRAARPRTSSPHRRAAAGWRGSSRNRRTAAPWPPDRLRIVAGAAPPVATRTRHRAAARRSAVVGVFTVLLAACAVWVQGGVGRTGSGPLAAPGAGRTETAAAHVWIVQPGDTLWAIARRLDPNGDVRPLVDALSRQVHGQPLQVGEQLRLP
jgi:LysM domain